MDELNEQKGKAKAKASVFPRWTITDIQTVSNWV